MSLEEARKRIRQARETNAPELDLSHLGLLALPGELRELAHLVGLDLSCNDLMAIPSEIVKLPNLTKLILWHNLTCPMKNGQPTRGVV